MKRKIAVLLAFTMLLTSLLLPSCNEGEDDKDSAQSEQSEQTQAPAENTIPLVADGVVAYTIVRPKTLSDSSELTRAANSLKNKFKLSTGADASSKTDEDSTASKEILIGETTRDQSQTVLKSLKFNEYAIKVDGDKIVICGASDLLTVQAIDYFIANYLTGKTPAVPENLNVTCTANLSVSSKHNITYDEMAATAYAAYTGQFEKVEDLIGKTEFWDIAEILEAYIDAYEATGDAAYLKNAEDIARVRFGSTNVRTNWVKSNAYNDDIAWICIAFARLYHLTGDTDYIIISKNNFDLMWERAYSPDVLGGGLWWKDDQKDTKNSCIQCPASIAACLIGKYIQDDTYYEKAKELMEWEFENLFVAEGENAGQVYDAKRTNGNFNYWASTYNQGTFVGACMLLHEKYGDQIYLDYADLAVQYGMTKLGGIKNGVLNGEGDGNDLIGFKGILTRWFYRYAEYTENIDILLWLQQNADTAYGNRNSSDLIWTTWANKTQDQEYDPWGLSAAIALLHNCQPWWDVTETNQ